MMMSIVECPQNIFITYTKPRLCHSKYNLEMWILLSPVQQLNVLTLIFKLTQLANNTESREGCFFFLLKTPTHTQPHTRTHTHTNTINTIAELHYGERGVEGGGCGWEYKLFYVSCTHFTPGGLSPLAWNVHVSRCSFRLGYSNKRIMEAFSLFNWTLLE